MPNSGVTIIVAGEDKSGQVFDAIKKHLDETRARVTQTAHSFEMIGGEAVPQFAAASAAVRAFEGTLSVRATERFLTGVLGLGPALTAAFPVIGALAFIDVIGQGIKRIGEFGSEVSNISTELNTGWIEAAMGKFAGLGDAIKQADEQMLQFAQSIDESRKASAHLQVEFITMTQGRAAGLRAERGEIEKNIKAQEAALALDRQLLDADKAASQVKSRIVVSGGEGGQGSVQEYDGPDALKARANLAPDEEKIRAALDKIEELRKEARNKDIEADKAEAEEKKKLADQGLEAQRKAAAEAQRIQAAQRQNFEADRAVAEAAAKLSADRAKAESDLKLAVLEQGHKLGLISEARYLDEKARIQSSAFAAERRALAEQRGALMQEADELRSQTPKDEAGRLEQQAKLNNLKKQSIELDAKTLDLQAKQAEKAAELAAARDEALKKQKAQIAEMEADLERLNGSGASKGIAAQRLKSGEERQNLANGAATPQQLAEFDALEKLKEQKLQVEALDREGERIGREAALAEAQVEQQRLSHAISARQADEQLIGIRANEIKQLEALAQAYAKYGEAGRDAEAKVQRQITESMQQIQKETDNTFRQIAEGYAHAIFDPLFKMGESWNKQWKQIRENLLRDTAQLAEKQLFGVLFGQDDKSGAGGRAGAKAGQGGALGGLIGQGEGLLGGLLGKLFGGKGAGVSSNGGLGSGAGTIPTAAAALSQLGRNATAGGGGIQIVINNQGPPMQVDQASQNSDGGEGQVIQIMMKQLETNGPVAQGIMGLFNI